MIGERSELLARLLRYHHIARGLMDSRAREAVRVAIAGIECRLAELDRASLPDPARAEERPRPLRAR